MSESGLSRRGFVGALAAGAAAAETKQGGLKPAVIIGISSPALRTVSKARGRSSAGCSPASCSTGLGQSR